MKISIIIPVYNVEKYIERCLESVINQTYSDIECILVDDCANDNSLALANKMLSSYSGPIRFKKYYHKENRGPSAARNTGIKNASGDYIYFLDSDDAITKECISQYVSIVEKYRGVDLVQGNFIITNPKAAHLDISDLNLPEYTKQHLWIKETMLTKLPCNACGKLIKTDFFLSNNLWFSEGLIHEDLHWCFFVCKHVKSIAFDKNPTYIRYLNEGSIMTNPDRTRSHNDSLMIIEDWLLNVDDVLNNIQLTYILRLLLIEKTDAYAQLKDVKSYIERYNQFTKRVLKLDLNLFTRISIVYLKSPPIILRNFIFRFIFEASMKVYDKLGTR